MSVENPQQVKQVFRGLVTNISQHKELRDKELTGKEAHVLERGMRTMGQALSGAYPTAEQKAMLDDGASQVEAVGVSSKIVEGILRDFVDTFQN